MAHIPGSAFIPSQVRSLSSRQERLLVTPGALIGLRTGSALACLYRKYVINLPVVSMTDGRHAG